MAAIADIAILRGGDVLTSMASADAKFRLIAGRAKPTSAVEFSCHPERGGYQLRLLTPFKSQPLLDTGVAINAAWPITQKIANLGRY